MNWKDRSEVVVVVREALVHSAALLLSQVALAFVVVAIVESIR